MKPILFNTEMVRAILEGRKTVTRRVVKPQPDTKHSHKLGYVIAGDKKEVGCFGFGTNEYGGNIQFAKPPYQVNDVLCVRETWRWLPCYECGRDCWEHNPCKEGKYNHTYHNTGCYVYKADIHNCNTDYFKWRPSIHMPKEAARIFLRVTDVRLERLQDMKLDDFKAEGTRATSISPEDDLNYRFNFSGLWDSTIKKDQLQSYGWEANPYVWVVEFERLAHSSIEEVWNG